MKPVMKSLANKFEFPYAGKEKIAKNTYTFSFGRNSKFDFIPGQYFKVNLQIKNPDARGSSRYFTISSPNTNRTQIQITTRIIKSSFKKKLHSLKPGERVSFFGPIGYFTFNPKSKKQKILLAGGIGITPFHSILTSLDYRYFKSNILLIASFSKSEDVIYYEELKKIEKENSNVRIVYALSKEVSESFEKGRINKELIKKYSPHFPDSEFFIVGSPSFEEEMFDLVRKMNVPEEKIFKENFTGY